MKTLPVAALAASLLLHPLASRAETGVEVEGSVKVRAAENTPDCKAEQPCQRGAAVFAPFALGAGTWGLRGTTRDFDSTTVAVGIAPDLTVRFGHATVRNQLSAHIGGGESGLEWGVGGAWMFGARLGLGNGAPFARVGLDTWFGGNSDFYHSHFEAPRFELGYQLLRVDDLFIEVGPRGGLMLAGRHRVFDRTRDIGTSLDAGGFATLQLSFLRLHAEGVRIFETRNEPKTPIDRGRADLCAILGQRLEFCAMGSIDRGEVSGPDGGLDTSASYLGLALGVGEARIAKHVP